MGIYRSKKDTTVYVEGIKFDSTITTWSINAAADWVWWTNCEFFETAMNSHFYDDTFVINCRFNALASQLALAGNRTKIHNCICPNTGSGVDITGDNCSVIGNLFIGNMTIQSGANNNILMGNKGGTVTNLGTNSVELGNN